MICCRCSAPSHIAVASCLIRSLQNGGFTKILCSTLPLTTHALPPLRNSKQPYPHYLPIKQLTATSTHPSAPCPLYQPQPPTANPTPAIDTDTNTSVALSPTAPSQAVWTRRRRCSTSRWSATYAPRCVQQAPSQTGKARMGGRRSETERLREEPRRLGRWRRRLVLGE